ncbi:isochorismatase family cysteine hydrolase [Paracoccus sp. PAR01]|uniref:isochorismatase family cysteine hydrolase n=1 Tax=Paracoccus sp. PAR01 TaxID=2769282 RepID=UPI00177CCC16|nr:isochorismatase family cysteine hydrolase [Paracoccus sp. PAR01]MBD9527112.1 cysteine hydrolase [Paracoccus sp. PAR01]
MSQPPSYDPGRTALLFVDPYNDFLAESGKLWPLVKQVATGLGLHDNLRKVLAAARAADLHVFIVPHHQWEKGDFETWDHPTPYQLGAAHHQVFAKGSWGAEWFPDFAPRAGEIVVKEHWGASGFANTDLDLLLKQRKVTHVVLIGLIANTCIEATGRFASELGYHVTLIRDATAAASPEALHNAHEVNGPTYAHAILTSHEFIAALDSV